MSTLHADQARTLLRQANEHLQQAHAHLTAAPPRYADVLPGIGAAVEDSLRAYLAWSLPDGVPGDGDVRTLVARASDLSSILRTTGERALAVLERTPALERTLRQQSPPGVTEREEVRNGWYTARNLHWTVAGELPAEARPTRAAQAA